MIYLVRMLRIVFLACGLSLSGCNPLNPKQDIVGLWKVTRMELAPADTSTLSEKTPAADLIQSGIEIWYEFKADGTYRLFRGHQEDRGDWQLSLDNRVLLLKSTLNDKDDAEFEIAAFTQFYMVWLTADSGLPREKITLEPKR
ncbi:MAG: hypothetical protein OHK0053_02290 [Microscillaceae bacterium]